MLLEKTIMAIDDSKTQLKIYQTLLKNHFVLVLCDSPIVALDVLKTVQVDLILLDIEMPEMTGFEFLTEIRANPALDRLPVIVISGFQDIATAVKYGANDFMEKPVIFSTLLGKINALLEPLPKP
ncbi:MAG: response regulator [Treponema sp.]|jgi:response regulator RpfG family c-di-GMP phosphodiesterase|nr:response regulator [Treponema sp.]